MTKLFLFLFLFTSSTTWAQESKPTEDQLKRGFLFETSATELVLKPAQKMNLDLWIKPLRATHAAYVVRSTGDLTGVKPSLETDPLNKNHLILGLEALKSTKAETRKIEIQLGLEGAFEKKDLFLKINP
ncbi:MAG: hypothetical protein HQM15_00020 [Deltaproteobacteria bacterium]|nr:hypothetical protein [Deltaproteobacteria bacterium]